VLGALAFIVPAANAASGGLTTTFDTDLEGWTLIGDNVYLWNDVDGNPGGCLEVQDAASGPWSVAVAPSAWLGSYAGFTSADSLIFEAIHFPSAGQNGNPPYLIRLDGPGGAAEWDPSMTIPDSTWNRFAAPFDSTEWDVLTGTWNDLLQNVSQVTLAAEMISGDETVRLDNICLTSAPSADSYQECEIAEFELGFPGWSSVDASLFNESGEGNPGRYLRVSQTDPAGKLIAPVWWYGDWSELDGDGSVSFSFTFLGDTTDAGRELRVEMSGPGGAAFVSVSTDAYTLPNRLWIDFSWPIDSGTWTVTSGTWGALLADVTELTLSCDYVTGSDLFGVDNFARTASTCTFPVEAPLAFYEPGYSQCGAIPFREGCALAINPVDGLLYATVDLSVSSEGGVFVLDGPLAGTRVAAINSLEGLVFTADGDGFAAENNAGNVNRFVGSDSVMVWASNFQTGDDDPVGLLVAPPGFSGPNVAPGDLIITDHGNGAADGIWAASPDTVDSERLLVGDPGTVDWYDLATDGTTVWACDSADDDLLWIIHPDGTTSTLALSQNITNKRAFAYDPLQNVLYTARTSGALELWRIDPVTGDVTLIADGFQGFGTGNLEIDPAARKLWVADNAASRVYEICLPTTTTVDAPAIGAGANGLSVSLLPNPMSAAGRILLALPRASLVRVDIVDARGRRVRSFAPGRLPAGARGLAWDGADERGRSVAAGVYFIRLQSDDEVRTTKAVVLR